MPSVRLVNIPSAILAPVADCLESMKDIQNFEEVVTLGKSKITVTTEKVHTKASVSLYVAASTLTVSPFTICLTALGVPTPNIAEHITKPFMTNRTTRKVETIEDFPCQSRVYLFIQAIVKGRDPKTQLFLDQYSQNLEALNLDGFTRGFEKAWGRYESDITFEQIEEMEDLASVQVPKLIDLINQKAETSPAIADKVKEGAELDARKFNFNSLRNSSNPIYINTKAFMEELYSSTRDPKYILNLLFNLEDLTTEKRKFTFKKLFNLAARKRDPLLFAIVAIFCNGDSELEKRLRDISLSRSLDSTNDNDARYLDEDENRQSISSYFSRLYNEADSSYKEQQAYKIKVKLAQEILKKRVYDHRIRWIVADFLKITIGREYRKNPAVQNMLVNFLNSNRSILDMDINDFRLFAHSDHFIQAFQETLNRTDVDSRNIAGYMNICINLPTSIFEHQREATDPMRIKFFEKAVDLVSSVSDAAKIMSYMNHIAVTDNLRQSRSYKVSDKDYMYSDNKYWDEESFEQLVSSMQRLIAKAKTLVRNQEDSNKVNDIIKTCNSVIKRNPTVEYH